MQEKIDFFDRSYNDTPLMQYFIPHCFSTIYMKNLININALQL